MEQLFQEASFHTEIKTEHTQGRIPPVTDKMQICGIIKMSHFPPCIFHSAFYPFQKSAFFFVFANCYLFKSQSNPFSHFQRHRVTGYFRQEEVTTFKKKKKSDEEWNRQDFFMIISEAAFPLHSLQCQVSLVYPIHP